MRVEGDRVHGQARARRRRPGPWPAPRVPAVHAVELADRDHARTGAGRTSRDRARPAPVSPAPCPAAAPRPQSGRAGGRHVVRPHEHRGRPGAAPLVLEQAEQSPVGGERGDRARRARPPSAGIQPPLATIRAALASSVAVREGGPGRRGQRHQCRGRRPGPPGCARGRCRTGRPGSGAARSGARRRRGRRRGRGPAPGRRCRWSSPPRRRDQPLSRRLQTVGSRDLEPVRPSPGGRRARPPRRPGPACRPASPSTLIALIVVGTCWMSPVSARTAGPDRLLGDRRGVGRATGAPRRRRRCRCDCPSRIVAA